MERFLEKMNRRSPNECWEWTAGCFADGYGAINVDGKPKRAPRVSYELFKGPIPDGLHIRHACDNPICVNPMHLETGTAAENSADRVRRGRHGQTPKITDGQVAQIRESDASYKDIAAEYGISYGLIGLIRGKSGYRVARPVTMSCRAEKSLARKISL